MKMKKSTVQLPLSTRIIMYVSAICNFVVTFLIIKYYVIQ
jgi:hypothetical protein